jgi:anti-sigma regulatory factor (Ser/Thr protein kinase)
MCLSNSATFPCDAAAPQRARDFCLACVREIFPAGATASDTVEDCLLVVSELVSNAVKAGCATVSLTVEVHRDHVRITAEDDAPGVPQRVRVAPGDRHGRGLAIVESLSRAWGVLRQATGKQVWADVGLPPGLALAVECQL